MNSFIEDAIRSSCEGIMVKSLDVDAGYSPSKRADTWLKVIYCTGLKLLFVTQILNLYNNVQMFHL